MFWHSVKQADINFYFDIYFKPSQSFYMGKTYFTGIARIRSHLPYF